MRDERGKKREERAKRKFIILILQCVVELGELCQCGLAV